MSLKPLSSLKAPDLISFDRESNAQEIMDRMKLLPGWQDIWTVEQHQDASQFVIQTFSYLFEKVANATNKNIRENFLSDAFSDRAIFSNLNQMRVNAIQNKEATVELIGRLEGQSITRELILDNNLSLSTTDITGSAITFEIIATDPITGDYDYINNVIIQPTTYARTAFRVNAYSGKTRKQMITLQSQDLENVRIDLPYENIIDGSIQAFYQTPNGILTKLVKTDKFVIEPYITLESQYVFPNGIPHYVIRYNENGKATLYFGSKNFGGAFELDHVGGSIVIFARIGGGSSNNIPALQINSRKEIENFGELPYIINFYNPEPAYGGDDRETAAEAQVFAPLRNGRDGTVVLIDDAKTKLYKSIVKHEIQTPEFSEVANNVPMLHAWHYIVPKRDFNNWMPVQYTLDEPMETYVSKLFADIDSFLKIKGTNDIAITKEMVYSFVEADTSGSYSFVYTLKNIKPLSGTLALTAWDYEDDLVDYIKWTGNYYTNPTLNSDVATEPALVITNSFMALAITAGVNNKLRIQFDNIDYTFELSIIEGTSVTPENLVSSLQQQMQYKIENDFVATSNFYAYRTYKFFSIVTTNGISRIHIKSPRTGLASKISILPHNQNLDPSVDLYVLLGITVGNYRPPQETRLVFQQSSYLHNNGDVIASINPTFIDNQVTTFDYLPSMEQNHGALEGPVIEKILTDEKPGKLMKLLPNSSMSLEALKYNSVTNDYDIIDAILYQYVVKDDITSPIYVGGSGSVFNQTKISDMEFNYSTAKATIKLNDGVIVPVYKQNYPAIHRIKLAKIIFVDTNWVVDGAYLLNLTENDCLDSDGNFGSWTQNVLSLGGKTTIINASNLLANANYQLEIYTEQDGADIVINTIRFETLSSGQYGVVVPAVGREDYFLNTFHQLSGTTNQFRLTFRNAIIDTEAATYYANGYDDFDMLRFTYDRKSYEYVTAAYTPNPYLPNGEAATYLSYLKDKSHKLLGLEHIIKNAYYAPVGGVLSIYISPGYSEKNVYDKAYQVLLDNFGYDNINGGHTIGVKITESSMRVALLKVLAVDYGVEDIKYTSGTLYEELDPTIAAQTYFFIADDTMIKKIKTIETESTILSGLSSIFQMKLIVSKSIRGFNA